MRSIRTVIFASLVSLYLIMLASPAIAGRGVMGFDSHIDKIDKMQKAGRITKDEAVYRKLQGLLEPKKLPKEYKGAPSESATFDLLDLQSEAKEIKDYKIKKLVDDFLLTADDISMKGLSHQDSLSTGSNAGFSLSHLTSSYSPAGSNFKIWYTQTGIDSVLSGDADSDNIPDFVESVNSHLNTSWAKLVPTFGEPPGPSSKYNVYLKDLRTRGLLYGLSAAKGSSSSYSWPSFIIIENDFATYPGVPEDNIKTTASHEFFHAIHYGYNPFHTDGSYENRWFAEASATWAESLVFPELKSYVDLQYRSSSQRLGWMANPEASLTTWDENNSRLRQYGSSVFVKFLEEQKGGALMVKNIWTRLKGLSMSAKGAVIGAIDSELRSAKKGTFNSFFAYFISKNFNITGYKDSVLIKAQKNAIPAWQSYPYFVSVINVTPYSSYPVVKSLSSSDKPLPEYLGANYHVFNAVNTGKTFYFKGGKDLSGTRTGKWIVNLLLRKKGTETYVLKRLMNPSVAENFIAVPEFNNVTYDRAVLAAGVVAPAGNGYKYKYNISAKHISTSSLTSGRTSVPIGGSVTFYGNLSPKHTGMGNVYLQKSASGTGSWSNIGTMPWSSSISKYKLVYKPSKSMYYRVFWRGDSDHGPNRSTKIKVTVQ